MEKTKEECNIIGTIVSNFDEVKGVNKPQLSAKMQPIKWVANGEGNLIETPTNKDDSDWYDYENQKWANAKTEDGSYWVWIPRYAYKIIEGFHSNTTGNIKIKFLKDTTNTDKEGNKVETEGYEFGIKDTSMHYFQHPAFKFGEDDLEGFWIAKFEPSGVENDINIFPNAESLTWMTVSEQFTAALNMKTNGKYTSHTFRPVVIVGNFSSSIPVE
ncbi:MAG: hypothetical protein PHX03_03620 [Bacilli bacterium]|nr:hypothetical protein [Bacilli bacterium]